MGGGGGTSPSACCVCLHTGLKKVHLQDTTEYKRKRVDLNELTKTKSKSRITKKPEGNMRSQSREAGPDRSVHKGTNCTDVKKGS